MKSKILFAAAIASFASFAQQPEQPTGKAAPAKSAQEIIDRQTGGRLRAPRKNTGTISYVNAQSRIGDDEIAKARDDMAELIKTPIAIKKGAFGFPKPEVQDTLSLFIIDDQDMPPSLVAPEARWAMVNVAPLATGRGEQKAFFEARFAKEMARVGSMLLGGIGSGYKHNLLSPITNIENLDKFDNAALPIDAQMRCQKYLIALGIKPWREVTYKIACEEGWAPAPTNELQQAIWDKVHEIPATPMKIEFDPKTGR